MNREDYNFTVLARDQEVARVFVSADHKHVQIDKLIPDGPNQPFGGTKLDLERVYDFLKDRCYEDGYVGLKDILAKMGMTSNDPWEWNRKMHGVTWEDFFWIRFEGETLKWEDVKCR